MSESYQALYRKWRPMTFADLVGQAHVADTLKNSVAGHRLAHAYLFCGTRGTGKTSTAKIFSRAVNCEHPVDGEPCNTCDTCRGILNGSILDVYEMDAASNRGVDDIRVIRDEVIYTPAGCTYKVYIIDEVHMLTDVAFNALLKTLEEPPAHAIFILAKTEPHKIPATILSRCQRFDFRRIGTEEIAGRLSKITDAEGIAATPDAIELIAELGDGSMRDALSILDQCAAFDRAELRTADVVEIVGIVDPQTLFKIADCVLAGDTQGALLQADAFLRLGKEPLNFFEDFIGHFRNLLLCKAGEHAEALLEKTAETAAKYQAQAEKCGVERIIYVIRTLSEFLSQAKWMPDPKIAVEMALVKACAPQYSTEADALAARLERLERLVQSGHMPAAAQKPAEGRSQPEAENTVPRPALQQKQEEDAEQPPWDIEEQLDAGGSEEVNTAPSAVSNTPQKQEDGPWELWPEALNEIKKESKTLYMFMYAGRAVDQGGRIEVTLPTQLAYDKIATPNGLEYLSGLFSRISGVKKQVSVVLEGSKPAEPKAAEQPSIMDLVKKKDLFGDKMEII